MKEIVTADNDFVNNKPAMEEMAKDELSMHTILKQKIYVYFYPCSHDDPNYLQYRRNCKGE